ncbi:MAG: M50 family metallopeptidase [Candidatus Melainabacteria bacterium]|nr:M50 family metallopeptidase [Candidatus Melainabacteria bacterium]
MTSATVLATIFGALPGIVSMVLGIMFLILIHEFGHWIVARTLGFQTPVFAIGFGKRSWSLVLGKFWDTEFRLSPILLGGYVSIPELQDETTAKEMLGDELKDYNFFPVWKRMSVAVAGVVMNVLFAIVAIAMLFAIIGQPKMEISATKIRGLDTQVSIAHDAGLQAGDVFVSVDGTAVKLPEDLLKAVQAKKNQPAKIVVSRNGKPVEVQVTPNADGRIGIQIDVDAVKTYEKMDAWTATKTGVSTSFNTMGSMLNGFGMMLGIVEKPAAMPDAALEMHGIVGIVQVGAQAFDAGLFAFVWILAMISLNLAIINILPIPMLDGGHMLFFTIEKIRGKAISIATRNKVSSFFFILLVGLMLWGLVNDIVKPIQLP